MHMWRACGVLDRCDSVRPYSVQSSGRFQLKAIVIREFGPPGVMKLEEVPTPEPGPGEVLIKVHAVSVNRTLDCVVRAGKYARRVSLPLTPGVDPSGIVEKVGPGVTER